MKPWENLLLRDTRTLTKNCVYSVRSASQGLCKTSYAQCVAGLVFREDVKPVVQLVN